MESLVKTELKAIQENMAMMTDKLLACEEEIANLRESSDKMEDTLKDQQDHILGLALKMRVPESIGGTLSGPR